MATQSKASVATGSDAEFHDALDGLDDRRRKLLAVVESDAREWPRSEES